MLLYAQDDASLLHAALLGYQSQLEKITSAIADLQKRLGNADAGGVPAQGRAPRRKKRRISAEGRARIAEAQRKRWADQKKSK
jgi:hypothetical protein